MNKIITCEECGIDYYSEAIVPRESFRHVFPDIVKLETDLEKANRLLLKTNQVHVENQQLQKDLDGEREINQRLTDELAEAQAEIETLKNKNTASVSAHMWLIVRHAFVCGAQKGYAHGTERKMIEQMFTEFCNRDYPEAVEKEIERFADIEQKDKLIEQMRVALVWLYQWVKNETEHFGAAAPDDEITKDVEAALEAAERAKE